jgi:hypothetical protein
MTAKFTSETAPRAGRAVGARNKITNAFLEKLAADFEAHGDSVIRVVRVERPAEYLKVVAALLPREFSVSGEKLGEMCEEELAALLEQIRELRTKGRAEPEPEGQRGPLH